MKGLLLKDWYLTVKYARTLLLVSAVFLCVTPFASENWFFRLYPCIMLGMLPSMLYSYDEREKWTEYVQALPVSRALYVSEKYLYGALTIAALLAALTLLYLAFGVEGLGTAAAISWLIGLLAPGLLLPLLFKFGAEKGRTTYLILMAALFGGGMLLTRFDILDGGAEASLPVPVWVICLAALLVYAVSWRLSIRLYQKREV